MTFPNLLVTSTALLALAACGQGTTAASAPETATEASTSATKAAETIAPKTSYKDALSGTYAVDKGHAYIVFTYTHNGYSTPYLRWRDWDSSLNWDVENPENSSVNVTIKTDGIDTGVDVFDGHLRSESWFDAATYPDITFTSTSLTKSSETTGTMVGDLTIKDVTKPVTLDVTFNKAAFQERSKSYKIGFSAKGSLNRSDFGLGRWAPATSDTVNLIIETEYAMKAE